MKSYFPSMKRNLRTCDPLPSPWDDERFIIQGIFQTDPQNLRVALKGLPLSKDFVQYISQ